MQPYGIFNNFKLPFWNDLGGKMLYGNNYMGNYNSSLSQDPSSFLPSLGLSAAAVDNSLVNQNNVDFYNANNNLATGTPAASLNPNVPGGDVLDLSFEDMMKNIKPKTESNITMDDIAQGVGIGADVLGAVLAFQQLGLAKDAFSHQQAMDRANLSNQVTTLRSSADDTNAARLRRAANNNINPNNVNTIDLSGLKTLGG